MSEVSTNKPVQYRVYRQDIEAFGGFVYLGKFGHEPGMSAADQIATAKRMFPNCTSPVVEPGR